MRMILRTRCGMCIISGQVNPYFPGICGWLLCVPFAFLHFQSSGVCVRVQEIRKSTAGILEIIGPLSDIMRIRPTPPMSFPEVYWCVFPLFRLLFTWLHQQTRDVLCRLVQVCTSLYKPHRCTRKSPLYRLVQVCTDELCLYKFNNFCWQKKCRLPFLTISLDLSHVTNFPHYNLPLAGIEPMTSRK